MKHSIKILAAFVCVAILGCSTLVEIRTVPDGAEVSINRQPVGDTPVKKELTSFIGNNYDVEIEKEGFETIETRMEKEMKVGIFIGGFFIWPLWLWCYGPLDYYYFELDEK